MQIYVYRNEEQVAKAAAMIFGAVLAAKPNAVLGLATGSTPIPTYRRLIALNRDGQIDFSQARTYNLDEYVGLDANHPASYRYFMNTQLFDHINIDKCHTRVPSGLGDVEKNAEAYDAKLEEAGGIDLQLLGIGHNGHIGFNEPNPRSFIYKTNVVTLTQSTIEANARMFASPDDVPRQAISLGIGGIMHADRIILLATGQGKASAVRDAVKGDITPLLPASIL
ncbi:MAG: glucosamine-6-phosphate deaminase, partial [Clostridia bacterium]